MHKNEENFEIKDIESTTLLEELKRVEKSILFELESCLKLWRGEINKVDEIKRKNPYLRH